MTLDIKDLYVNLPAQNILHITKFWLDALHDHPSCLCCPDALSMVGNPLSGNGCGSPNHI